MPKAKHPTPATIDDLPAPWASRVAQQPARMIPGYWNTWELSELLGVSRVAVNMQVMRGAIRPVPCRHGTARLSFFTDEEVSRYLTRGSQPGGRQSRQRRK